MITLSIENLEIDWGKNSNFTNHSRLFLPGDVAMVPYLYADEFKELKQALVRQLASVKKRLELLGYSLANSRLMYEQLTTDMASHCDPPPPFELFADVLKGTDLEGVPSPEDLPENFDFGEYVPEVLLRLSELKKKHDLSQWQTTGAGYFFENLDPYIVLRLLLENPRNLDRTLVWRYADVVEGGWLISAKCMRVLQTETAFLSLQRERPTRRSSVRRLKCYIRTLPISSISLMSTRIPSPDLEGSIDSARA
jgi:hypothetical protein